MVKATDYCGLVSGKTIDKSQVFEMFYGELQTAPMIAAYPLSIECKLVDTIDLPTNIFFIGEIIASYTEEQYLTDGKLDIKKMNPLPRFGMPFFNIYYMTCC
jgi:flavin reductase (DIM6/NTAB) family NADH-FMN oxidoreductase RutF